MRTIYHLIQNRTTLEVICVNCANLRHAAQALLRSPQPSLIFKFSSTGVRHVASHNPPG